ncbi:MAG: hypothetical protein WCP21_21950 [Armatimonadota bacterium]
MNEQRFRILEPRALYEIGLPTAVLWVLLWLQVLLGGRRVYFPGFGINLLTYNVVLALGFTAVWLLAYQWTRTEVVVSPKGLSLVVLGRLQWFLPWPQLLSWRWDWHWANLAQGLLLVCKDGTVRPLRLGFLGLGRPVAGIVQVYPYYVPLIKALGYYLQGEQWREPLFNPKKAGRF